MFLQSGGYFCIYCPWNPFKFIPCLPGVGPPKPRSFYNEKHGVICVFFFENSNQTLIDDGHMTSEP